MRQERVFQNRFGQNIFEDILYFSPSKSSKPLEMIHNTAREIARETLEGVAASVPDGSREDWKSALDKIDAVNPSPRITELNLSKESIHAVA